MCCSKAETVPSDTGMSKTAAEVTHRRREPRADDMSGNDGVVDKSTLMTSAGMSLMFGKFADQMPSRFGIMRSRFGGWLPRGYSAKAALERFTHGLHIRTHRRQARSASECARVLG